MRSLRPALVGRALVRVLTGGLACTRVAAGGTAARY